MPSTTGARRENRRGRRPTPFVVTNENAKPAGAVQPSAHGRPLGRPTLVRMRGIFNNAGEVYPPAPAVAAPAAVAANPVPPPAAAPPPPAPAPPAPALLHPPLPQACHRPTLRWLSQRHEGRIYVGANATRRGITNDLYHTAEGRLTYHILRSPSLFPSLSECPSCFDFFDPFLHIAITNATRYF
ncbi:hypothetical protein C8Q80DRAFT_1271372 [Daedaleopsis nitida]|nr:hypothetical protein C8Q80DRAFT_1271372 [Daedaleopsis nitida]